MPRKPRIHYPGAVYHVILRGNAGQNIFFDTADRYKYFHLLQEGIERFNHSIHAFCLMSNHVHLVIQANDIPLSRIMHNLNFRYTAYLNRRMKTSGHIFQGRYKAILVEADNYLLELIRYIHNNPVVAGIVMSPDNYRWSSHSVYIEKIDVTWLTTAWALSFFSKKKESCY
ncbi:MAG: transposase [bacterium]|nr:transposase [bacterium]